MGTERACWCGEVFIDEGTLHGQPSGLWALLEHQETAHADVDLTPQLLAS